VFSSNCGKPIPSESKFCIGCGSAVAASPVSAIMSAPGPTIRQSKAVLLPNLTPLSLLDIFLTSQCVLRMWLRHLLRKNNDEQTITLYLRAGDPRSSDLRRLSIDGTF
jgi:hypothetical protein